MALTYGIESLAVINKGGGLRRLALGQTTDYLRGDMTWAAFPTEMAPTAHTHLYAGSATAGGPATTALACTGNAATATKLATTRALTIGSTAKNFDGSAAVSWTLAEIGAAPTSHEHSYAGSSSAGGAATTALACTGNSATATKLATPRTISLSGSVTGSVSFDGSGDVSISTTTNHTHAYSPTSHASSATTYGLATASLYGHAMASSATPLVAGTASVGTDNGLFAREGHVHPAQTSVSGSSGSCTGNAATATILTTPRALTIGSTAKNFDGSAAVSWTLAEIGAAATVHNHDGVYSPVAHTHDTAYLKLTGGTLTGQINLAAGATFKNSNSGWNNWKIPYFSDGEMIVGDFTVESFAPVDHQHDASKITTGTLGIARGGTGKSSFTAYGIVLGGTTTTGALQSMTLGTARQILASGGAGAAPQWLTADEYERFSVGGTAEASATVIGAKTGISEKLVFIDPGAETTPQTISYFKAPLAANQEYGDRIVIYCCSGNETYKYIVLPNGTEKFCDLIGGQYTGNIEASYGNKIELVCLPKSGAKAWYVSRIALINNN